MRGLFIRNSTQKSASALYKKATGLEAISAVAKLDDLIVPFVRMGKKDKDSENDTPLSQKNTRKRFKTVNKGV